MRRTADLVDAELLLVGRAEQLGPDEWRVRWTSWSSNSAASGKTTNLSGSVNDASAPAVDKLVNDLVNKFTVAGGEAGTLELVVENIAAVDDYAKLLKYLSSRSYVENVNVAGLVGDELTVLVTTTGTPEKFMQLLARDSKLVKSNRKPEPRSSRAEYEPLVVTPEDSDYSYGSRSAISVPEIADAILRVAWQG